MQTRARSLVYRELAYVWRTADQLDAAWPMSRRHKLPRLIAAADYGDFAAEMARLVSATAPARACCADLVADSADWESVEPLDPEWTGDPAATLPFSHLTAYLLGDAATHVCRLGETLGLTFPDDMPGRPDRFCLELELMSMLCLYAPKRAQSQFLRDRLSWIPDLHRAMLASDVSPAALALCELTLGFLAVDSAALKQSSRKRGVGLHLVAHSARISQPPMFQD